MDEANFESVMQQVAALQAQRDALAVTEHLETLKGAETLTAEQWNRIGEVYAWAILPIQAVGCFDRAIALDPQVRYYRNKIAANMTLAARLKNDSHNRSYSQMRYLLYEAERLCEQCLRRAAPLPAINLIRVAIYCQTGRLQEAIALFEGPDCDRPTTANPWIYIGACYHQTRQYEKALDCYSHALEIEPENGSAQFNTGLIYEQLEKRDLAIEHYRAAVARESDNNRYRTRLDALTSGV